MSDAPPSYDQATGSSGAGGSSRLQVPGSSGANGRIPIEHRRSMEDEGRQLPSGWIRQYDHTKNHQYFVDTKANPPRSIWHHPYDDDTYLRTLSSEERERIEEQTRQPHPPSRDHLINSESDVEDHHEPAELPPRPTRGKGSEDKKFGRKLKDKLTGTTHEQREQERRRQAEADAEMYRRHQMIRQAMQAAFETGQPQLIGKDKDGKDVYIEPPRGGPFQQRGGYGYNPYSNGPYSQQPYTQGNNRYIPYPAPTYPYAGRPAYGYGMGMPLMGGLMGGALLGGLLF